ncbi:PHP domain-containing protein [Vampirovibrio sp.]|uniref:PHP domain-containing protein n=1 Tax=Vampirovibrio sp. TaxID=2717857 RepID=UPI0035946570
MIDLHMHTIFSDGSVRPEDLVQLAVDNNLEAIAITDHDTTESLAHAQKAAEGLDLEIIPGIEVNTVWKEKEIHILGYYIDPEDSTLQAVIENHRNSRVVQIQEMAQKLKAKARLNICYEDIIKEASDIGTIGRPHVARAIIAKGGATTISQAFNKFLNPRCETYVRRKTVPPHEAVEAIHESGGIAVIAHPGDLEIIEELAQDLMNYGLRGLEAYHRSHSPALIEFHCSLAEKLGLIVTGGTDFHGTVDLYKKSLDRLHMPPAVYRELHAERKRRQLSAFKAS